MTITLFNSFAGVGEFRAATNGADRYVARLGGRVGLSIASEGRIAAGAEFPLVDGDLRIRFYLSNDGPGRFPIGLWVMRWFFAYLSDFILYHALHPNYRGNGPTTRWCRGDFFRQPDFLTLSLFLSYAFLISSNFYFFVSSDFYLSVKVTFASRFSSGSGLTFVSRAFKG